MIVKEKAHRGTETAQICVKTEKTSNRPQKARKAHRGENKPLFEQSAEGNSLLVRENYLPLCCLVKLPDTKNSKNMNGRKDLTRWSSLNALSFQNLLPTKGDSKKLHSARAAFKLKPIPRT